MILTSKIELFKIHNMLIDNGFESRNDKELMTIVSTKGFKIASMQFDLSLKCINNFIYITLRMYDHKVVKNILLYSKEFKNDQKAQKTSKVNGV